MKMIKSISILFLLLAGTCLKAQTIQKWKLKDLQSAIKNAKKPTVFNFWATYCVPCIKELPHFKDLADQYKNEGVTLILVSLDLPEAYPNKIQTFAKDHNMNSMIVFLDESDADLFCPIVDKSWSGAIPATLFINPHTHYHKFLEDEISKEKFKLELEAMLGKK